MAIESTNVPVHRIGEVASHYPYNILYLWDAIKANQGKLDVIKIL